MTRSTVLPAMGALLACILVVSASPASQTSGGGSPTGEATSPADLSDRSAPASLRSPFWGDLEPGPYRVSLVVAHARDDERLTRSWSPDDDPYTRRGRPLRLYMWYPISKLHKDPTMTLREYVHVDATDTHGQPMTEAEQREYEARFVTRGERFGADTTAIRTRLGLPTMTLYQALGERGQFPTVLVAPGLDQPKPFDHVVLCEYLASHGYYVASLPFQSARTSSDELRAERPDALSDRLPDAPPDELANGLSNELLDEFADELADEALLPDLYHQVRDLEWLLAHMREQRYTDTHRFGVVGHGTGSLAALLLQVRNPDVRGLVLLDPPFDEDERGRDDGGGGTGVDGTDGDDVDGAGVDETGVDETGVDGAHVDGADDGTVRSILEQDPLFDSKRADIPILSVRPVAAGAGGTDETDETGDLWGPLRGFDHAPRMTMTLPGSESTDLTSLGVLFTTPSNDASRSRDSSGAPHARGSTDASRSRNDALAEREVTSDAPRIHATLHGVVERVHAFLDASLRPDPGAVDAALQHWRETTSQASGLPAGVTVFHLPPGNSAGEGP